MNLRIDAKEVEALAQAWRQAPDMVADELLAMMTGATLLLQREIQERTPRGVTHHLSESIQAQEPERLADQVLGVVSTPILYAVPVEMGTKPHHPPIQPLVEWARLKLGLSPEEAERAGFLIAKKIAAHGTKGAFMFARALDANREQLEAMFDAAAGRIVARLADTP